MALVLYFLIYKAELTSSLYRKIYKYNYILFVFLNGTMWNVYSVKGFIYIRF